MGCLAVAIVAVVNWVCRFAEGLAILLSRKICCLALTLDSSVSFDRAVFTFTLAGAVGTDRETVSDCRIAVAGVVWVRRRVSCISSAAQRDFSNENRQVGIR